MKLKDRALFAIKNNDTTRFVPGDTNKQITTNPILRTATS